jgi:hypothetical protein
MRMRIGGAQGVGRARVVAPNRLGSRPPRMVTRLSLCGNTCWSPLPSFSLRLSGRGAVPAQVLYAYAHARNGKHSLMLRLPPGSGATTLVKGAFLCQSHAWESIVLGLCGSLGGVTLEAKGSFVCGTAFVGTRSHLVGGRALGS